VAPDDSPLPQVAADLDGVEVALARLDDDSYFTCEVCGEPIPGSLLSAAPTGRRCGSCSTA
jgi:RNA polymerase-binding transcription factor DksA